LASLSCAHFGDGARKADLASVHQDQLLAELLGLLHDVGREHDGGPFTVELEDGVAEAVPVDGVKPGKRLIEDEQLGLMDHGGDELELLRHALREGLDPLMLPVGEVESFEPPVDDGIQRACVLALDLAEEVQQLENAHLLVEAAFLGEVTENRLEGLAHLGPEHLHAPGIRPEDVHEHADARGLPRTVRAQDPEQAPLRDLEGDVTHRLDVPEVLRDALEAHSGSVERRGGGRHARILPPGAGHDTQRVGRPSPRISVSLAPRGCEDSDPVGRGPGPGGIQRDGTADLEHTCSEPRGPCTRLRASSRTHKDTLVASPASPHR